MPEAFRLPMSEQAFGAAQSVVLSHLDLRWPNIIVDDYLNNLVIIDWEWTGSIPRQLFTLPFWVYREEFTQFRSVILYKSETSDLCRQLAEETLPIAELLRRLSQLIAIFYQALYPKLFEASRDKVVPQFFERSEKELALEVQR
ncbi:putative choline kinase 3 [Madurella mycetomatis]|uniref:Choline kinase 3 n=1 Tax=Madurella mycetomatis TaxID=100816 RepID=A0A175WFQ6_9PEZI|nr:putative choline kinase 3 [Madurella mycetomatis]